MQSRASLLTRHLSSATTRRPQTVFSGIQPTGVPHLGNLFGALSNWVKLQDEAHVEDRVLFSVVGLHAITLPQESKKLAQERSDILASLLAIGIDPAKSILFHQDQVSEHAELAWILNCLTPMGKLQRMTTWKSKLVVARNANNEDEVDSTHLNLGLFSYPVLQAADVLLYKTTHVPVGEDQQQHIELSRDIAEIFNRTTKSRTFPLPQHVITPAKRILSLRDPSQKMSKSAPNVSSRILITDSYADITSKIKSAVTDSTRGITYSPSTRPGISNLLIILASCRGEDPLQIAAAYESAGKSHAELKKDVIDAVEMTLAPIRKRYSKIKGDVVYLRDVSESGASRARSLASETMREVKLKMGLQLL